MISFRAGILSAFQVNLSYGLELKGKAGMWAEWDFSLLVVRRRMENSRADRILAD